MATMQEPQLALPHKLILDGREKLTMDGVKDIESFDENMVVLQTVRGTLIVHGEGLHLQMLSLDGGQVAVDGKVDALTYENTTHQGGLFSRLFGG